LKRAASNGLPAPRTLFLVVTAQGFSRQDEKTLSNKIYIPPRVSFTVRMRFLCES
jgi:hypothetical protein